MTREDVSRQAVIRRGFVDVTDGQIHYREAGSRAAPALVLVHASPGSARGFEPLMAALAKERWVIAPDTMGNGDSAGAMPEQPEIPFFAGRLREALDGLSIENCDLYGAHTGGSIAAQLAIDAPHFVRKLALDGIGLYPESLQAEILERYAPELQADLHGSHLNWIWHFVRDTYMFWPWYATDAAHARKVGLPAPETLHDKVVDVAKAYRTYHLSYRAAFRFDKRREFARIAVPTLAACAEGDMLAQWHDEYAALIPGSVKATIPSVYASPGAAAEALLAFFRS
ncbi:alpha/beta fold hydrolase [Oceanibacterium hippocampi]|uniref:AB hydrolase superfamily protein YvaM n=1 Tax=Oceanibacterium hippocampi TaxID=745714 RepID=A0A1Y5TY81_9PROT|nr:alpha/beta hydrolase [Oceanibacterium hippocampi]SLN71373.1 AB hydrolase superfamily protein YvaM [Oceanibacterium hippocampi]